MATKEQIDAAEKKVYSQEQIGEFMTTWKDFPRPGLAAWSERKKAGLMNTARSTRYTPKFRPFDMLSIPNQSVVMLENENHRIGAECVVGVQDAFHRYVDCDMVYFQFCGNTTVETEFGVYEMEPGRSDAGPRRHFPSLHRAERQPALFLSEPGGGGLRHG